MSWKYVVSTQTQINLGTTDSVFVGQYVTLGGGIIGTGSNHHVIIDGTVAGDTAVQLGDDFEVDSGQNLEISETGKLFAGQLYGVKVFGYSNTIANAGKIISEDTGVFVVADQGDGQSTIVNSGVITGGTTGVYTSGSQAIALTNTGKIEAGNFCYGDVTAHSDTILNKGTMTGQIGLGGGPDRYDGRQGHVTGKVWGGFGDDTLYGGSENNTFTGEEGLDKLYGAGGADTLSGGADADTFIFRKTGESTVSAKGRDTITDFTQAQSDRIDLHSIDANTHLGANQTFEFIGHQGFHHQAGELRYATSGGDTYVYADTDGDAKSDFSLKLEGDVGLSASDFIL